MDTKSAYDLWSKQYDKTKNQTRDIEAKAIKQTLGEFEFSKCLEIGCGTGKNTEWLIMKVNHITAVDFSDEMTAKAKEKISSAKVQFINADIIKDWNFTTDKFDLITFSLVLEHIKNLDHIFQEASRLLKPGGLVYLGELHPYKQYLGTKARFESEDGLQILDCYVHNISDFIKSARKYDLDLKDVNEFFDEGDESFPRILVLLFRKNVSFPN